MRPPNDSPEPIDLLGQFDPEEAQRVLFGYSLATRQHVFATVPNPWQQVDLRREILRARFYEMIADRHRANLDIDLLHEELPTVRFPVPVGPFHGPIGLIGLSITARPSELATSAARVEDQPSTSIWGKSAWWKLQPQPRRSADAFVGKPERGRQSTWHTSHVKSRKQRSGRKV